MAVKKISKKASKKKVTKKKVSKVSSANAFSVNAVFGDDINEDDIPDLIRPDLRAEARGEFRGDFTRDTFNPQDRFSRVLMQQGRVQLDADWNEQNSIMLHHLRNLACDVGSQHWGPNLGAGFKIEMIDVDPGQTGLTISPGHYYVNGLLCEVGLDQNGDLHTYSNQADYPLPDGQSISDIDPNITAGVNSALVYLDVWERHYTYINDDSMREVALAGPDTATRAKIIWQVKILPIPFEGDTTGSVVPNHLKTNYRDFLELIELVIKPGKGKLCAKLKDKADDNDPCLVAPESRYRGPENQLYRVEIHQSGVAEGQMDDANLLEPTPKATYKWSRENASVIFPIIAIQGSIITLEHLGKDCRYGLERNNWVELIDDDYVLQCRADNLWKIEDIDEENRQVTLSNPSGASIEIDPSKHAYLRRWDHKDGKENGIAVVENSDGETWLEIEDGIQIQFKSSNDESETDVITDANGNVIGSLFARYQTGDYWLIPARTVTGDIEWPSVDGEPKAQLPHGAVHHYAPLAILNKTGNSDTGGDVIDGSNQGENIDLRRIMIQTWT